jgi:alkanesulfonate monooxygenase SsuD/methylene tetrahydromethanopterin reductase-like flavin-dependent oxidoreductase (luciferase family)
MANAVEIATTAWNWKGAGDARELCRQAERAEQMGFHSFWLPENHFGGGRAIPSPLTLLAAVAARTENLKLGCTSYLLPIRHPLQAAEEVAVLDQLCGGRLILGLGRGIQPAIFRAFDIDASDKRSLFSDKLEIMRAVWRGDPVGQDEHGEPICLSPLPVQQPSPPLWVAAFGPLALKQAAGLGLPYLASPMESLALLTQNYVAFNRHVAEAGQPVVKTVPVMRTVFASDRKSLLDTVRSELTRTLPSAVRDTSGEVDDWAIVGEPAYVRDKIAQHVEQLGLTHLILRGGLPGISEAQHLRSHECVLEAAG